MKSFTQKDADDVRETSQKFAIPKELSLRLWDIANRLEREANRYVIVNEE